MTPPPVSETAAWTERDEAHLHHVLNPDTPGYVYMPLEKTFAVEIRRLRAENERLNELVIEKDGEICRAETALRLAAATRERETPPEIPDEVSWEIHDTVGVFRSFGDEWEARQWIKGRVGPSLVRATTSRSRVSDNG